MPDDIGPSDGPVTQVRVFRKKGIEVIDPLNLRDVIMNSNDIEKVIVEKISINEATRVSLLFEPNSEGEDDLGSEFLALQNEIEAKVFDIEELENFVNKDFLKCPSSSEEAPQEEVVTKQPAPEVESPSESLGLLKFKGNEEKSLQYEKHTFSKKKKKKAGHSYYYRAKDHVELYKVGSSYLKDFKAGLRSFSFSSCGLDEEREKTVLGILSFFNYHQDVNICVITNDIEKSFYRKLVKEFIPREEEVFSEGFDFNYYQAEGFDAVEYRDLKKVERKLTEHNIEDFIDQLMGRYDLVLWDLPQREILDSNKELYFPIIRSLDNVSFVIQKNVSKISDINELVSYFNRYQIPIKGLLFSDSSKEGGSK